jgi:3-(3-hydroxy-phenyl)propionate hydroxylase
VISPRDRVLVVGAGPVGLTIALGLVRRGIPVLVIEQEPALTMDPRAGTFHPPTLEMLEAFGLTEKMVADGIAVRSWQIRDRQSSAVAEFDLSVLADLTPYPYRLHLEQFKLTPMLLEALEREPLAEVRFATRFIDADQDEHGVRATVESRGNSDIIECRWLIGADGGRSNVRRAGKFSFEGFTWPELFIVLSTPYDYAQHGFAMNSYLADPEQWIAIFKMPGNGPPGVWRLSFPISAETPEDVALAPQTAEELLQGFIPRSEPYVVDHQNTYRLHQRVAGDFRAGRIILAGDAAHINNPVGAFGLNSGIHDAMCLIGRLDAVWHERAGTEALDRYVLQRRTVAVEHVQANSIRNKRQLEEKDPDVRRRNFEHLQRVASKPELSREFLITSSMIASVRRAEQIGQLG